MEDFSGPIMVLDGDDCADLAKEAPEAIKSLRRCGENVPPSLLRLSLRVNELIRGSAAIPGNAEFRALRNGERFRDGLIDPHSAQMEVLGIKDAAKLAGCSEEFMRRCCRRGDVQAFQDEYRSAWKVDISSLAAYVARRRKDRDPTKAA